MTAFSVALSLAAVGLLLAVNDAAADDAPDPARVAEIAPMLPEAPEGVGRPITDREAWDALAAAPECQAIVSRAERLLAEPLAEQPDELYLEFSQNGNRTRYQSVAFGRRRTRFNTLVVAECLEDRGRFLPAIEEIIAATCAERTWVLPAHDRSLANFNGERIDIDLFSSEYAWQLATANWLLGDHLSPAIRETIRSNVSERVLEPFRAMYSGAREPNSWLHVTNNWNAVCLAGVVGAALAQIDDRDTRAEFIAAAEKSSQNFLNGCALDGYCSEGLGYWNYGFGHYILLAETIYQATDGAVDFMTRPGVAAPAPFGARIQIIRGVAPSFADCAIGVRPDTRWMHYISRRYGLDLEGYSDLAPAAALGTDLNASVIFAFPNTTAEGATLSGADLGTSERAWFSDAGILISRPMPETECLLAVALKGGNNAEHHNHNDVGSYVAVVQDRAVLMDPGSEVYTARTFSGQRYESNVLNSWGHPVPVVAGKLQRTGRDAQGVVLASDFSDDRDALTLDIRSAYDVPELTRLERAFAYDRAGDGSLTITDTVAFASPQSFETPLITDGAWERVDESTLLVRDANRAAHVRLDTAGAAWELVVDEIEEDAHAQPTRLAIRLSEPVTEATVAVTITPIRDFGLTGESVLCNGDFALGADGWTMPATSLGSISSERAAVGENSLKITDESDAAGSSITSARIAVEGPGRWLLRGQVYHESGSGIGTYLRFFDTTGARLNEATNERGDIAPVGSLEGPVGEWAPFEFAFDLPEGAASMDLWIHSFNAAQVVAFVDDLQIVPAD